MWNVIKRVKNPNLKRDCPEEKRQRNSLYDQEKWIRTLLEGHGCNTRPNQKRRRVHARP
jgi:hypothetical protein